MSNQSLNKTFEQRARVGVAYLWLNPPINPETGFVDLALSGNVSNDIIPDGVPRPATGGMFLGWDESGIVETPLLTFEPVPLLGSTVPIDVRIKEERGTVKSRLLFNNEIGIVTLFRPPGINQSLFSFSYGGKTKPNIYPLLIIITNELNEQDYVECHYYFRGYFEPSPITSGKLFSAIDMTYNALAAFDGNCLLPEGSRIMRGWFVRVDVEGNNTLVAPTLLDHFGASGFLEGQGDAGNDWSNDTGATIMLLTNWLGNF